MKKILFLASLSSLIFLFGCSNPWKDCINSAFELRNAYSTCLEECGDIIACHEICMEKSQKQVSLSSECDEAVVSCTKTGFTWDYREQCVICQLKKDTKNCDMFK